MKRPKRSLIAALGTVLACSALAVPAASASVDTRQVSRDNFQAKLSGSNLALWKGLSREQQDRAVGDLNRVVRAGKLPTDDAEARAIAPELSVTTVGSTVLAQSGAAITTINEFSAAAAAAATYEVHSTYSKKFGVFGITYTTATIDYYYTTGSGRVLGDHACVGKVDDYLPGRTISQISNHWVAQGKGNCIVTWNVRNADGLAGTVITDQGMIVNGSRIEKTWGPQ